MPPMPPEVINSPRDPRVALPSSPCPPNNSHRLGGRLESTVFARRNRAPPPPSSTSSATVDQSIVATLGFVASDLSHPSSVSSIHRHSVNFAEARSATAASSSPRSPSSFPSLRVPPASFAIASSPVCVALSLSSRSRSPSPLQADPLHRLCPRLWSLWSPPVESTHVIIFTASPLPRSKPSYPRNDRLSPEPISPSCAAARRRP